jgi:hypothetical protein
MELLFQALDEFDDLMTWLRQVWLRHGGGRRRDSRGGILLQITPSREA